MAKQLYNVLFLCTGNSARSIMAEALLNHRGDGLYHAYSAGSLPVGQVHPVVLKLLSLHHLPTEALRSKSWDEFAQADSMMLDFVITVCDKAAHEVCPCWSGQPLSAHWGVPDPAAVMGSESDKIHAFQIAFTALSQRIQAFLELPMESLDSLKLKEHVDLIGCIS